MALVRMATLSGLVAILLSSSLVLVTGLLKPHPR